ncbi:hypothetical protein [uncultured Variovorax sp.]|uniref:hypothetical protein n=1 Tax=uncultured Variovorax sp. TaxID=114708 RepID=UPI0026085C8C|nr:hypothetical protein [uncultured Variovorax sp.]
MLSQMLNPHVDIRWTTEAEWFASGDAAVVRAGVLLLEAAARSSQPATLPASAVTLARLAGMSLEIWAEKGESALAGFDRVEGGWRHRAMHDLQAAVQERFGAQLQELAASSVLAGQAVDEFPLVGEVKPAGRSKGKRALPKDFVFSPALIAYAESAGFLTPAHQDWLLTKFRDFASSNKRLYSNWDATARNYISSSITGRDFLTFFGYWPRDSKERLAMGDGVSASSVLVGRPGPQSFEKAALNASTDTMNEVLGARYGKSSAQDVPFRASSPERTASFGFNMAGGAR